MQTYAATLDAYLKRSEMTQADFAAKIGKTQPAVHRYCEADRFPDADTAREIDAASNGEVSFRLWQVEFLARSGLAA